MEYKFKLLRMHCAACALALEEHINKLEGVTAQINYVTKILKLKIETEKLDETLELVKKEIVNFDHMIQILDYEDEEDIARREKKERNKKIIRLSVATIIMIANIFNPIFWLQVTIFALDYILVSYNILISAVRNIAKGKVFDENFLMTIASIGAFIIQEFVEAICVMLLFEIGSVLEDLAVSKSRKTIKSLLEIKQPYANLVQGDTETKVELGQVEVGNLIRIKPGERIPLDGEIVEGTSYLNMSALTGETKEKIVQPGDKVLSGSINGSSVLLVKVEKLESESTVTKIIELVEKATESKAKSEKFISKFSRYYTPTVIVLALIIMFIPPIFSGYRNFETFAYRSLCFLVISCPCALVISVPLTYFAGLGSFAKCGIMVKGSNYIETLAKINSIVFDKTGTLTKGEFEISEIYAKKGYKKGELLEICAYAESFSNHSIAKSVLKAYADKTNNKVINTAWINGYEEVTGKGIKANIFLQDTIVGNAKFLRENGVRVIDVNKAGTTLYISINGKFAGYIVISDTVKPDAEEAVKKIKELGIEDVSICTGDEESVAKAICSKIGIKKYFAGLLPEDKVFIITDKVQEGKTVAFVGDGINDAPSLANANVGIAMGGLGSDIAVEASDVVVMTDEPSKVAFSIKKAKKTHKIVLENIIGSIGIKIAIMILVAFGISGMWLAVFADVGVNLLAVLNSLRALLK